MYHTHFTHTLDHITHFTLHTLTHHHTPTQVYEELFKVYVTRVNFKMRMRKLHVRSIRAAPVVRVKLIELGALPSHSPVCGLILVSEVNFDLRITRIPFDSVFSLIALYKFMYVRLYWHKCIIRDTTTMFTMCVFTFCLLLRLNSNQYDFSLLASIYTYIHRVTYTCLHCRWRSWHDLTEFFLLM